MVSMTLEVPDSVYPGQLIGPRGKNIRMIQDYYHGVQIDYRPQEKRYLLLTAKHFHPLSSQSQGVELTW